MHEDLQALTQRIQPLLAQLERERQQILKNSGILIAIASLAGGILALLFGKFQLFLLGGGLLLGIIIAAVVWVRPYRRKLKRQLIEQVVKFVSSDLHYDPESGVGESAYVGSRLFPRRYDRFNQEDLIAGKVGQTRLTVCEIHSEYSTKDSKGNRNWHTIFRGLFYILDFPKSFRGTTIITPDGTSWLGGMGDFLQGFDSRGELVKLEDPEFERIFAVHSSDQIEARYLLSTSLMERILRLRTRGTVSLAFIGGNLYVAIASDHNLFEPSINLFQPVDGRDLAEHLSTLSQVLSIVDALDLNTRIWQ